MKIDWIEVRDLIITILTLGFCFSFKYWGETLFDLGAGLANFSLITFLVAVSILIHELSHRLVAWHSQAELRYRAWVLGLAIALLLVFLTNGWFVFAVAGAITIVPFQLHRPGRWEFFGPYERAKVAVVGPLTNFLLAVIAVGVANATGSFAWRELFTINAWLAVMNLVPFFRNVPIILMRRLPSWLRKRQSPPFLAAKYKDERLLPQVEGETVFFGSRPMWIFFFVFVTVSSLFLAAIRSIAGSLLLGFVAAFALYATWQYYVEPWAYEGKRRKKPHQYKA